MLITCSSLESALRCRWRAGGITFRRNIAFGDAAHCYFAEPCASPLVRPPSTDEWVPEAGIFLDNPCSGKFFCNLTDLYRLGQGGRFNQSCRSAPPCRFSGVANVNATQYRFFSVLDTVIHDIGEKLLVASARSVNRSSSNTDRNANTHIQSKRHSLQIFWLNIRFILRFKSVASSWNSRPSVLVLNWVPFQLTTLSITKNLCFKCSLIYPESKITI